MHDNYYNTHILFEGPAQSEEIRSGGSLLKSAKFCDLQNEFSENDVELMFIFNCSWS